MEKWDRSKKGLNVLAEALAWMDNTEERWYEADLYRIKGELILQSSVQKNQNSENPDPKSQILNPDPQGEAEACFLKAIDIAQKQQAKSLELRAVMRMARL